MDFWGALVEELVVDPATVFIPLHSNSIPFQVLELCFQFQHKSLFGLLCLCKAKGM